MKRNPTDPAELTRVLAELAPRIDADGVTCWLAEADELVAIANPLEPEIVGLRQPLQRGLISQVLLTGQAILESDLSRHPDHDPAVDQTLRRRCQSMMAAPCRLGDREGVISAVRHEGHDGSFSLEALRLLSAAAHAISSLRQP